MKTILAWIITVALLFPLISKAQSSQKNQEITKNENSMKTNEQVYFIDKFIIPATSKIEFSNRMNQNRELIRTLPGFIKDDIFESKDENGNYLIITIATWENQEALATAKEIVQTAYKAQGFDPAEMLKRLNIKMDRGIYKHPDAKLVSRF